MGPAIAMFLIFVFFVRHQNVEASKSGFTAQTIVDCATTTFCHKYQLVPIIGLVHSVEGSKMLLMLMMKKCDNMPIC